MTPHLPRLAAVLAIGALVGLSAACDDGGGGGGGTINFTSGFTFIRDDNGDVYVADQADYSTVGRLTTNGGNHFPALSLDGRQVVFVHVDAGGANSLMTVATTGGGVPRTVYTASAANGEKNFKNPVFSPDGATIVFTYEVASTAYLATVAAADGSGFDTLTTAPSSYASPTFFPASVAPNVVVVAVGSQIGSYDRLEQVDIGTGQLLPLTNNLGNEVLFISGRVALSRDGTKLAFDARPLNPSSVTRIFVLTLSSGAVVRISDTGAGSATALHTFPSWTSATQVAFVSNEGGAPQVYTQPITAPAPGTGTLTLPSADEAFYGP